ncbi:MAG: hypothetical protein A3D92_11545 [Bacteroidetes bacterium RIFCSPHIGHO2_02_FULL_44_7]|nr:MAG: hypothetical protein A3D92_11545 [Bacteroidetes bacterium RIFCSPHIGHO2_02_FULL_44_7]
MQAKFFSASLLGFFLAFFSFQVHAQAGPDDVTPEKLQAFWNSNIQAMISLDKEKIIEQTYFPLAGEWYAIFDMWESTEEELQEVYVERLEEMYNEEFRSVLSSYTWENIGVAETEEGTFLSIYILFEEVIDDEVLESAIILEFSLIEENWMLTAMTFAG